MITTDYIFYQMIMLGYRRTGMKIEELNGQLFDNMEEKVASK